MLTEMMMIGVEVMMKMGTIMTKQMILINGHDRRQFAIEPSIKSFRSVQKILVVVLELVVDWLIDSIILVTIGTVDVLIDEVLRMFVCMAYTYISLTNTLTTHEKIVIPWALFHIPLFHMLVELAWLLQQPTKLGLWLFTNWSKLNPDEQLTTTNNYRT